MNQCGIFRILAMAWLILITYLSLTSTPPVVDSAVLGWDKFQHAMAYLVLTLLTIRALLVDPRQVRTVVVGSLIFSIVIGGLMEFLQGLMHSGRVPDIFDLLANSVGAIVAATLCWFWHRRTLKERLVPVLIFCALICGGGTARAGEQRSVAADAAEFIAALPAAGSKMATFPVNPDVAGPWWTLTAISAIGFSYTYDAEIRQHLQGARSPALDDAADTGALVGNPLVHVGLVSGLYAGGYLFDRDSWCQTALKAGEALFLADAITLLAKEAIGRGRPDSSDAKNSFRPFQFDGRHDALPSLHTASSFALATVLAGETDNWLLAAGYYGVATWVGAARMIQNRHWASDVVLGATIGSLSGWSVRRVHQEKFRPQLTVVPLAIDQGAGLAVAGRWP